MTLLSIGFSNASTFSTTTSNDIVITQEQDTAKVKAAVRELYLTVKEMNKKADNESLKQLSVGLGNFANKPIFRGDRYKLDLMEEMAEEQRVQAFIKLDKALLAEDQSLWEEFTPEDPVFEYLVDIAYEFNEEAALEGPEQVHELFDKFKKGGAGALEKPKGLLDTGIDYDSDSSRLDFKRQLMYLTGNAKVVFGERELKAGQIEMAYTTSTVKAYGITDSVGNYVERPVFKESGKTYNANEMLFNYKTNKGIIKGIVTEEGDAIIQSGVIKKTPKESIYMEDNVYTTCTLEHPHYGIRSKRMKIVPRKHYVTGPFLFELNEIPLPIGFPLGLFPAQNKRSSGIILPGYGEFRERGFALENGGFFWGINDYVTLTLTGSIFTLGSWNVSSKVNYRKRYSFSGNFGFDYANNIRQQDDGTSTTSKDYRLIWSHTQQTYGSSRFSASVNLASSNFNQNNSYDVNDRVQASTNSSIRYSNNFTIGNATLSANSSLRHNQNLTTGEASINPDLSVALSRIRPFAGLFKRSQNILSQLNLSYTGRFNGEITNDPPTSSFPFPVVQNDTEIDPNAGLGEDELLPDLFLNFGDYIDDFRYNITHNIPISTNFTVLKYFNVTPSANYTEYWVPNKYDYTWNGAEGAVEVDTISSFARYYEFSTSASVSTNMYMFYDFTNGARLRQAIRPTVSMSFRPDFGSPDFDFYQEVQTNENGSSSQVWRSSGALGGSPSVGQSANMSFSVSNQFELKKKRKEDEEKAEKIKLVDDLSLSSSYDFARDSLNLSNISLRARTRLFNIFDVSFASTFDPYRYVPTSISVDPITGEETILSSVKTNDFLLGTEGKLARLTQMNISIGARFSPKNFQDKAEEKLEEYEPKNQTEELIIEDIRRNPSDYINFEVPWSLSVNYIYNISRTGLQELRPTQNIRLRGDLSLTPKWKVGYTTAYDIEENEFTSTQININRDLHCWQMTLNWVPFGRNQSYSININVKSSVLQDLKWQRQSRRPLF
ncbi:putative LPS assembly protein LptD [Algivirga pacifica]